MGFSRRCSPTAASGGACCSTTTPGFFAASAARWSCAGPSPSLLTCLICGSTCFPRTALRKPSESYYSTCNATCPFPPSRPRHQTAGAPAPGSGPGAGTARGVRWAPAGPTCPGGVPPGYTRPAASLPYQGVCRWPRQPAEWTRRSVRWATDSASPPPGSGYRISSSYSGSH